MLSSVRVGIVGTGRISDLHAVEYVDNPKAQIVALCDRDPDLARARARKWGVDDAKVYTDVQDLLRDSNVDMVEILLPHHLHLSTALAAIAAGKAVSLQKPMCMSMDEANTLVNAAEAAGRPFRVFENFIFYPPVMKAKELVEAGAIGEPLTIRVKSNPGDPRTGWTIPPSSDAWRQSRQLAGGGPLVFDDGHHHFALAWYFMGNPEVVHAFIGETTTPEGFVFDAPAMISFRFPGNRMGNLEIVYSPELEIITKHYAQDDRVEITGTKGVLWINCGHGRIGDPPPVMLYREGTVQTFHNMATGWEASFIQSVRHYIGVLTGGGAPLLTVQQGRDILRFSIAAEESGRTGKAVEFRRAGVP